MPIADLQLPIYDFKIQLKIMATITRFVGGQIAGFISYLNKALMKGPNLRTGNKQPKIGNCKL